MTDLVKLLSDLVAIPSMNPMGRYYGEKYCEKNIAAYIYEFLAERRVDCEVYEVYPNRPNVVAYIDAGRNETLLLEAHMDTVSVENMQIEPFNPQVRDNRLYGRGSCDTKGSLAAMLLAISDVLETRGRLRYSVLFAAISDEEFLFSGAKTLVDRGFKATFGIVGEPTQLDIVNAHKGMMRWRIHTKGVAMHGAYPEAGRNAIYSMGHVLAAFEKYSKDLSERSPDKVLGLPTVNIGTIKGGLTVNTVPDECTIEVDRRTMPDEESSSVMREISRYMPSDVEWEMEDPYLVGPGLNTRADAEIVRLLNEACELIHPRTAIRGVRYGTDAAFYAQDGVPTVVFGPGDVLQAHSAIEYVDLEEAEMAKEILKRLMRG
jgi:acetylornithine deacetylase